MNNMKYFLLLILAFVGASCSDEFLEKEPLGQPSSQILTKSEDGIKMLLNATYANTREFGQTAFPWFLAKELGSDDTNTGSVPGDGNSKREFNDFKHMTSDGDLASFWSSSYTTIAQANLVITNAPNVEFNDVSLQARYIGEAKFLRAQAYLDLVRGWGPVPIVTEVAANPTEASEVTPQSPVADVYKFIETDLLAAIADLPLKSEYPQSELGRITKGAAQTLLAQTFLHQLNYPKCLEQVEAVIASGEYSLYPEYYMVSNVDNQNGAESIYEIQMKYREEKDMTNNWQKWQGVRGSGSGWGFFSPSEELADAYEAGDPRREATIYFKGEPWPFSGDTNINWAPGTDPRANQKTMLPRPFSPGFAGHSPLNRVVLRYADVLLMASECYNELGQTADALTYLEMIRERAREGAAVLPEIAETDKVALRHLIWDERRFELALEGYRAYDIRRYDVVETGFAKTLYLGIGKTAYTEGKHELYPIPQSEMDFDEFTKVLQQNPGW